MGHAHGQLKLVERLHVGVLFLVAVESLAPRGMLTRRRCNAELFLAANINALGGAGPLGDPSGVNVGSRSSYLRFILCFIGLLL